MSEQALERIQKQLQVAQELKRRQNEEGNLTSGDGGSDEPPAKKKKEMSEAVKAGIAAGNINITTDDNDRMELSDVSKSEQEQQSELLQELERRSREREIILPATDEGIILKLRALGEPVTLFGELPADRRIRLRAFLADQQGVKLDQIQDPQANATSKKGKQNEEVWYHRGSDELLLLRKFTASYSLARARARLKTSRLELARVDKTREAEKQHMMTELRKFTNYGSQIGDVRPLAHCRLSPDGSLLATASWTGNVKLWDIPTCHEKRVFTGHGDRVSGVAFHPQACVSQTEDVVNLASCSADRTVKLWSLKGEEPIATMGGFGDRVARVEFHPSGKLLGATCFDYSWRLFDVSGSAPLEVLHQEGHSGAVYDISFHPDGSLCGTSSVDCTGRIWDLRTGKNVMLLKGHTKQVLCLQFSPNGYHVATGGDDNSVRIWDLRKRQCVYTLPAHNSLVSGIRYHPSGNFFVTSSYDKTVKVWTSPECSPLKVLHGHEGKVMAVDVSPDANHIVSSSWDRTFKLWAKEQE
eukprot:m.1951 g.1951  ORF g.1951 m.1951 type:complete len:527 (-) comp1675_c0_seq1:79-1659(-)